MKSIFLTVKKFKDTPGYKTKVANFIYSETVKLAKDNPAFTVEDITNATKLSTKTIKKYYNFQYNNKPELITSLENELNEYAKESVLFKYNRKFLNILLDVALWGKHSTDNRFLMSGATIKTMLAVFRRVNIYKLQKKVSTKEIDEKLLEVIAKEAAEAGTLAKVKSHITNDPFTTLGIKKAWEKIENLDVVQVKQLEIDFEKSQDIHIAKDKTTCEFKSVFLKHIILEINKTNKTVKIINTKTGEAKEYKVDKHLDLKLPWLYENRLCFEVDGLDFGGETYVSTMYVNQSGEALQLFIEKINPVEFLFVFNQKEISEVCNFQPNNL